MNEVYRKFAGNWTPSGIPLRTVLLITLIVAAPAFTQPTRRIVPRHPAAIELPELGHMRGLPGDCNLGYEIHLVGDANGDGIIDWVVSRDRCDTFIDNKRPDELLFYKGLPGRLPDVGDRTRIGPTEIGANTSFVAAGDWDADGYSDLATKMGIYRDTTYGLSSGKGASRMIIWWGSPTGYNLNDTTWLLHEGDGWGSSYGIYSRDFNQDGVDDLMMSSVGAFIDGVFKRSQWVHLWFGSRDVRWGDVRGRRAEWWWWNPPRENQSETFPRVQWIDQDMDGYEDMVLHNDVQNAVGRCRIRIIYGKPGVILDTANIVELRLDSAKGTIAHFMDVTGDKVPELVVNVGSEEVLKVFVGFRGQRLLEQYGQGNEPGHPDQPIWWGKPWATIPLVGQLHDGWAPAGFGPIFDFGDGGLDGIGDIWVYTVPDFICYNGGNRLDSLYDGWITRRGPTMTGITVLGDIDGSGRSTIAFGYSGSGATDPGGVVYFVPTVDLPETGVFRRMVPGTEVPISGIVGSGREVSDLNLHVKTSPGSGDVAIRWNALDETATLMITDVIGQTVSKRIVERGEGGTIWDASTTFGGLYYFTLVSGDRQETVSLLIQR